MNGVVDLLPVNRNFLGSNNAQSDLVSPNLHHGYRDVVVDDNTFVFFSWTVPASALILF